MSNRVRLRSPDRKHSRARTRLRESATDVADPTDVEETAPPNPSAVTIVEAAVGTMSAQGGRRYRAKLIEGDRWGSSGYYRREILERDGPTVWPAGTLMYLDHPTLAEEAERPERSVKDLAAKTVTTPAYDGDGLYADIEVFPHALPLIESLGATIGLSVRGMGTAAIGTVNGHTGPIIESLTHGDSIDFVTRAGAGGRLVSLLEAVRGGQVKTVERAKRTLGAYLEAQLHLAFTQMADDMYGGGRLSREERIALSAAIGDGLTAFTAKVEADAPQLFDRDIWDGPADDETSMSEAARLREATNNEISCALDTAVRAAYGDDDDTTQWIYVNDFDTGESLVWFTIADNQARRVWQQGYTIAAGDEATVAALVGDRTEVVARTEYVPLPDQAADAEPVDAEESAATRPTTEPDDIAPSASIEKKGGSGMTGPQNTGAQPDAGASEAAVTEARAAREQAETALAESMRERDAARVELARFRAVETARPIATTMLAESQLPAAARDRVAASVLAGVPMTEAGGLDEAAFRTAVTDAITAEGTYIASLAESDGAGRVTGLGGSTTSGQADADAARAKLTERYIARGMSPDAAKIAAAGRP